VKQLLQKDSMMTITFLSIWCVKFYFISFPPV